MAPMEVLRLHLVRVISASINQPIEFFWHTIWFDRSGEIRASASEDRSYLVAPARFESS